MKDKETLCFMAMCICLIFSMVLVIANIYQLDSIKRLSLQQERINAEVQYIKNRFFIER